MIAIVCMSRNPDLVEYFKCKLSSFQGSEFNNDLIALKNSSISVNKSITVVNSSYMKSAFFDARVLIDIFILPYITLTIFLKKVKVIHFTTAHISNLFLSILLKPFNIYQIFTIHDLTPHPGKKSYLIRLYNKLVIKYLSNEVISFSKKEISNTENPEKFKHFELSGFPQYIKQPKAGCKTILFFGRIDLYKGMGNLYNIINMSNRAQTGFKFIIAGKGIIENYDKLSRLDNVDIMNRFIKGDEIEGLFEKASFTILPYDSATQSGVSILSYAHATPVISYDVGSLGEYLVDGLNGYLINHQDNEKIIDLLKKANDSNILEMSKHSINEFNLKYSYDACKNAYYKYYLGKLDS